MKISKKLAEWILINSALAPGFNIICKGWQEDDDYQEITYEYLEGGKLDDDYFDFQISEG